MKENVLQDERTLSLEAVRFGNRFLDYASMGVMVLAALALAIGAVADLEWPCEIDFYRDMGAAQGMLDGNWFGDPAYRGAVRWYNPLTPAIFASLSWLTSMPLHAVFTRLGPYVNILGPIFFTVLASMLVGRSAAVPALAAYLFLGNADEPSWFHATYSPWSWPMNASQGFFYAALASYVVALRERTLRWQIAAGALLGVTALSHTAPALIMAIVVASDGAIDLIRPSREWPRSRALLRIGIIGGISLAVSLPFLLPILLEHRFAIRNPIPSSLAAFWGRSFLRDLATPVTFFSAIGLLSALRGAAGRGMNARGRGVLLLALGVSFALFAYSLGAQTLAARTGARLPQAVPAFHFHLYFKAMEAILFGAGMAAAARALSRLLRRLAPGAAADARIYATSITAVLIALHLPSYVSGADLHRFRNDSLRLGADTARISLYRWILANTDPEDVFLAEKDVGIYAVAAAGRKVVVLDGQYSNPYLSYEERLEDRDAMFEALESGDMALFARRAESYAVRYVIDGSMAEPCCKIEGEPTGLREVAAFGRLRVLRVEREG